MVFVSVDVEWVQLQLGWLRLVEAEVLETWLEPQKKQVLVPTVAGVDSQMTL